MVQGNGRSIVLMADDDDEDCMLAREAFKEAGNEAEFACVLDGVELMDYLSERSRSGEEPLPKLILLDLNMPKMDGRRALVEIKSRPEFQAIPIVIVTTSREREDIAFTMNAGAEAFVTKPGTFGEWISMMRSLAEQWL